MHPLHDVIVSVPSEGSELMDEGACCWSQVVDASSGGRQGDGMSPGLILAPEPYDLIMHVNWCALSGDGTLDPVT